MSRVIGQRPLTRQQGKGRNLQRFGGNVMHRLLQRQQVVFEAEDGCKHQTLWAGPCEVAWFFGISRPQSIAGRGALPQPADAQKRIGLACLGRGQQAHGLFVIQCRKEIS